MKRIILIAGGLLFALLIGSYGIPSGKSDNTNRADSSSNVSSSQSTPAPSPRNGVTISHNPEVTVYDENPESEDRPRANPPTYQPVAGGRNMHGGTGVFINGRELTSEQATAMARLYHYPPVRGHYWYDSRSGAWGIEGREAAGFLLPGHDFGPMSPSASHGNTGVFINGRQINMIEAVRIQQTFGAVYRGHWWLDGRTGYYGLEGNPMPLGNIITALQSQRSGRGGDNFWCSATACGNDNGHSGYVSVDGVTVGYDH